MEIRIRLAVESPILLLFVDCWCAWHTMLYSDSDSSRILLEHICIWVLRCLKAVINPELHLCLTITFLSLPVKTDFVEFLQDLLPQLVQVLLLQGE